MSKNFQVLIAFVENNEMSFVSSSRVENLNERRRNRGNTSLPLILLDADRLRWDRCCLERVVVRFADVWFVRGFHSGFIRDTCDFTNVARIRMHIRRNDEARRDLNAASEMQFARVQTRVCMYIHTHTHTHARVWIRSRTFVPSLCSHAFLPSLRHETHTPSRATHFEFIRIREVASTGKWHLNPSIIPHVVPLPMKH